MNLGEAKDQANSYIANFSNGGVVISDGENADYVLRYNRFANTAQFQVAEYNSIFATYPISQNFIDPLNGRFYGFNLKTFIPNQADLADITGLNGRSFYGEVDKPCTIYAEELNGSTWTNVTSVSWLFKDIVSTTNPLTVTNISTFKAIKALITPSNSTKTVRVRFTGLYPFTVRNRALWNMPYAIVYDVPIYSDRIYYKLPSDFYKLDKIIHRTDDRVYEQMVSNQWKEKDKVVLNYFDTGSFDVQYFRYPCRIYDQLNSATVTTEIGTAISGTTSTVVLPSTSSTVDKYYNGQTIEITAGTGVGQKAVCIDYVAKTNELTVQIPFTVSIDSTSVYSIKQYTDDSYIFETYEEATQAIPFFMASKAIADEMPSMGDRLLDQYNSRIANLLTIQNTSVQTITSTNGW